MMISKIKQLIGGIRTLNVGRAEDLPYWSSPPIQFVYEQTAALNLGQYDFGTIGATNLTPNRPIIDNALYYFRNITLAADIAEFDYVNNVTTTVEFRTFLSGDANAVLFREPIVMNKFYEQFDYRLFWQPRRAADQLLANFTGTIFQGAALVGKANVTLKAIISAQEIVDENFIYLFRTKYPNISVAEKIPTIGGDFENE